MVREKKKKKKKTRFKCSNLEYRMLMWSGMIDS